MHSTFHSRTCVGYFSDATYSRNLHIWEVRVRVLVREVVLAFFGLRKTKEQRESHTKQVCRGGLGVAKAPKEEGPGRACQLDSQQAELQTKTRRTTICSESGHATMPIAGSKAAPKMRLSLYQQEGS